MNQTKLESVLERTVDLMTGVGIAWCTMQYIVVPLWNLDLSPTDNLSVTLLFTAISFVRGYIWRRFFNAGIHKQIHKFITRRSNEKSKTN